MAPVLGGWPEGLSYPTVKLGDKREEMGVRGREKKERAKERDKVKRRRESDV